MFVFQYSKPRVFSVQELYRDNPDLLHRLSRVISKQRAPVDDDTAAPSNQFNSQLSPNSAFNSTTGSSTIPHAFNSKATHFTPIVLSDQAPGVTSPSASKMATGSAKNAARAAKPIRTAADEERIAEKIKQLKKNILKNRAPVNLVTDIENDVTQANPKTPKPQNP